MTAAPPLPSPVPDLLRLLTHEVRWRLVTALAQSDRRVQELVALLQRPQNLVSYHLRLLREGHVVRERRSSADGRDIYYSLELDDLRMRYLASGQALHPALTCAPLADPLRPAAPGQADRPIRVLFLCTHNSARSQMAEGILRKLAGDMVEVASAGSVPSRVHPLAVWAAASLGVDISSQHSRNMQTLANRPFDYVITVCDQLREICPVFSEPAVQIHWSCADPAAVAGSDEARRQAFLQTAQELATRIEYFRLTLEHQLRTNQEQ